MDASELFKQHFYFFLQDINDNNYDNRGEAQCVHVHETQVHVHETQVHLHVNEPTSLAHEPTSRAHEHIVLLL